MDGNTLYPQHRVMRCVTVQVEHISTTIECCTYKSAVQGTELGLQRKIHHLHVRDKLVRKPRCDENV